MARVTTRFISFSTTPSIYNPLTYPEAIDVRNEEMQSRCEQIDAIGQEINTVADEVNVLRNQAESVTSTASSSATLATQKAVEANNSANQALTYKNQIQGYVIPSGTSYSVDQINTQNSAMTKAQFNALAEERKANRAGSGFDEMGKHNSVVATYPNINEGMWSWLTPNSLILGKDSAQNAGISKTLFPVINVNGVINKLFALNSNSSYCNIILPTASNIYPYDTVLTAEQIASGVIKHADASNSGLIVNGKFDTNTSGWTNDASSSWSLLNGKMHSNGSVNGSKFTQVINTVIGKQYTIEFEVSNYASGTFRLYDVAFLNTVGYYVDAMSNGRFTHTWTATATTHTIICSDYTGNFIGDIDNIAVFPADAISRSDLSMAESFHEDISEKNFVYPYGNTQYLGGNTDGLTGIVAGAYSGANTYSLFGNWQAPNALVGKGYTWSALTDVQRKAFIANHENNCYLDGDKAIQVRYRVRVIQGLGDSWTKVTPEVGYLSPISNNYVVPKGKNVSKNDIDINTSGVYGNFLTGFVDGVSLSVGDYGTWQAVTNSDVLFTGAYEGKCFALPIALVHRRNQGMYHNVYNPNGTKLASDGLDCFRTSISFASISDCFNPAKLLTASGYIGTVSGRPDGLFSDQVHEGDILDLRNSSKKVEDYNRLINREFNKLVAGTYRGKEGTKYTEIKTQTSTGTVATVEVNDGTKYGSGAVVYIYDLTDSVIKGRFIVKSISGNVITVDSSFAKLAHSYMISGASSTRIKSNTILVCDVIGNPSSYPTAWKQNEMSFTTLHTAEDGTSLLPDGVKDSFKLSRKANTTPLLCLRSTDNGVTWTSFTPTFSTITNAITLTDEPAGNLVVIYYQTHTSMAVPTVNSEVLEYGKVLGTNGISNANFISTLIGKVPTSNTAPYLQDGYNINAYRIDASTFKWSTTSTEIPNHTALTLSGGASGVPAVKVLPYLTRLNGKAYLNLVFKEMKHNGTSWGDDAKFNIVDNVSTATDNNAQIVLIGQKIVELPYFIGADE